MVGSNRAFAVGLNRAINATCALPTRFVFRHGLACECLHATAMAIGCPHCRPEMRPKPFQGQNHAPRRVASRQHEASKSALLCALIKHLPGWFGWNTVEASGSCCGNASSAVPHISAPLPAGVVRLTEKPGNHRPIVPTTSGYKRRQDRPQAE
jgi:hypothetical protein